MPPNDSSPAQPEGAAGDTGSSCQSQPYPATISTTTTGFVDGNGCPVLLNGFVIDAYWGDGTSTWGASTYQQIATAGFTAVRMWINWSDFEPTNGAFSTVAFQTLDNAIQSAQDAKLYVILCPIFVNDNEARIPAWAQGGVNSIYDITNHASGYLQYVANRYLQNKTIAAYDLVNEPGGESLNDLLTMYATAMADVRTVDATRVVFIEPQFGDSPWTGADWSNFPDRANVALSMHDYFAGDGQPEVWDGVHGYTDPNDSAQLEAHLLSQLDVAAGVGIPLEVGEFGLNPYVTNADSWVQQQVAIFKKYGVSYIWWDYNCVSEAQRSSGDALAAADENCNWMPVIAYME